MYPLVNVSSLVSICPNVMFLQVDKTPPVTGQVWDGRGLTDQDYSQDNWTVSAWWRGFSDDQSYIDHYEWCVGTQPGKQDVVSCHDVGLHTRTSGQMSPGQMSPGQMSPGQMSPVQSGELGV